MSEVYHGQVHSIGIDVVTDARRIPIGEEVSWGKAILEINKGMGGESHVAICDDKTASSTSYLFGRKGVSYIPAIEEAVYGERLPPECAVLVAHDTFWYWASVSNGYVDKDGGVYPDSLQQQIDQLRSGGHPIYLAPEGGHLAKQAPEGLRGLKGPLLPTNFQSVVWGLLRKKYFPFRSWGIILAATLFLSTMSYMAVGAYDISSKLRAWTVAVSNLLETTSAPTTALIEGIVERATSNRSVAASGMFATLAQYHEKPGWAVMMQMIKADQLGMKGLSMTVSGISTDGEGNEMIRVISTNGSHNIADDGRYYVSWNIPEHIHGPVHRDLDDMLYTLNKWDGITVSPKSGIQNRWTIEIYNENVPTGVLLRVVAEGLRDTGAALLEISCAVKGGNLENCSAAIAG